TSIETSYTLTATSLNVTVAVTDPAGPRPAAATVCFSADPGPIGVSVKVTGVALEMSPSEPSAISVIRALNETVAVPPGVVTCTESGLDGAEVTTASSRLTVRRPVPELFTKDGLALMKFAVTL